MKKYLVVIEKTGTGYSAYSPVRNQPYEQRANNMTKIYAHQIVKSLPRGRFSAALTIRRFVKNVQKNLYFQGHTP
jgi:hypothetical protein